MEKEDAICEFFNECPSKSEICKGDETLNCDIFRVNKEIKDPELKLNMVKFER